jgi:hypothetical protein
MNDDWPVVRAGDTVTFHASEGDVEAQIVRFDGVGGADITVNGATMTRVREGTAKGQWDAIPPRQ